MATSRRDVMAPNRLLLVLLISGLAIVTVGHPSTAHATSCACRQHAASAEAGGTCSRTEDEKKCTLTFTTTTPEEYTEFLKRLQNLNLKQDPRETLRFVFEKPPETWPDDFVRTMLPVLFAISQRTHFATYDDFFKSMSEIRDFALLKQEKEIGRLIRDRDLVSSAKKLSLDPFTATISYGCIELQRAKFYAMVKTRWSAALNFCDDFPKK
jgi:hypothetical protein